MYQHQANINFMEYDYNKIICSLAGFYKPEYDELCPEEITRLYLERKQKLSNRGKMIERMYLQFAKRNINMIIGFYKDKKSKRNI